LSRDGHRCQTAKSPTPHVDGSAAGLPAAAAPQSRPPSFRVALPNYAFPSPGLSPAATLRAKSPAKAPHSLHAVLIYQYMLDQHPPQRRPGGAGARVLWLALTRRGPPKEPVRSSAEAPVLRPLLRRILRPRPRAQQGTRAF